jgi:hypothetical protein
MDASSTLINVSVNNKSYNIEIKLGIDYKFNSIKKPNVKYYIKNSENLIIIGDSPYYGNLIEYNNPLDEPHDFINEFVSTVHIDDTKKEDYTLVVEHTNGAYPDDYINGDFGIDITSLNINGVELTDLIHRKGTAYLDCTSDPYYLLKQINNKNFYVDLLPSEEDKTRKEPHILNYRHSGVKGLNPYTYNRKTGEKEYLEGVFISSCGEKYVKDGHLYYICDKDVHFIVENAYNKFLYVDPSNNRIIHEVPKSTCLNLNGRWEFKFKTPFYGWVVDNIFGND